MISICLKLSKLIKPFTYAELLVPVGQETYASFRASSHNHVLTSYCSSTRDCRNLLKVLLHVTPTYGTKCNKCREWQLHFTDFIISANGSSNLFAGVISSYRHASINS